MRRATSPLPTCLQVVVFNVGQRQFYLYLQTLKAA